MKNINTEKQLEKVLKRAYKREDVDDHLNDKERKIIVDAYRRIRPNEKLPDNLHDAFVYIIFT